MNTDDRLRHAADEMNRVTASVSAPSIDSVQRSARLRGAGVALATAAAVVVLLGGGLFLLRDPGQETVPPAAPPESTTTTEPPPMIEPEEATTDALSEQSTTTTTTEPVNPDCSGSGISPSALAISSFPQPVAQKLAEIVDAARVCDFDRLEEVAGDQFTASFGGMDPSELWTFEEENGYEPMMRLMQILDLRYGTIETENGTLFVWPAAHAHQGDWGDVPVQHLEDLRTIFTEEELRGFSDFGGYIGHRVGIWEDGTWSFFVEGD